MRVKVKQIRIPAGSTIGYGKAVTEDGTEIEWAGDHRPMRHLAEALEEGDDGAFLRDEFIELDIEDWQLLDKEPVAMGDYEVIFDRVQDTSPRPLSAMVILLIDEETHSGVVGVKKIDDEILPLDPETMLELMRLTIEELTS